MLKKLIIVQSLINNTKITPIPIIPTKIIMLFFSLIYLALASPSSDFIQGFLSGFHGTDVMIGEYCLDTQSLQKISLNAARIFDDIKSKQYFSLLSHTDSLISGLIQQSNECHLSDIRNILGSFSSLNLGTIIYRFTCNLIPIIREIQTASPKNPYTLGFHLAKVLKFIHKEDSKLPSFNTTNTALLFEGFLLGLIPQSPACSKSLAELGRDMQKLMNSTVFYLNGESDLLPVVQYEFMLVLNDAFGVEFNCKALTVLKMLVESLFTKSGFVKAYLRFGMKLIEVLDLMELARIEMLSGNYKAYGEYWGKIFSKVIK